MVDGGWDGVRYLVKWAPCCCVPSLSILFYGCHLWKCSPGKRSEIYLNLRTLIKLALLYMNKRVESFKLFKMALPSLSLSAVQSGVMSGIERTIWTLPEEVLLWMHPNVERPSLRWREIDMSAFGMIIIATFFNNGRHMAYISQTSHL